MDPFWADPAHSCPSCGASDVGFNPDNCRCGYMTGDLAKFQAWNERDLDSHIGGWFIGWAIMVFTAFGIGCLIGKILGAW